MEIIRANQVHVAEISRLFDLYRQFYKCESDLDLAKEFIADRINNKVIEDFYSYSLKV